MGESGVLFLRTILLSYHILRKAVSKMQESSAISQLQRRSFCRYYLLLGNAEEAAVRAGFPPDTAAADALALLQNQSCRAYLAKLSAQPAVSMQTLVLSGLARLAFGSAKDAVKLVFSEEMPSEETLAKLDLFQVSELKRDKGGGVEVRLFDRQKALERLLECAVNADSSAAANALISALSMPQEEANALDDAEADALFRKAAESP